MTMSKPAGVQLRRWFTYLVVLLLFVNIAAVVGSIVIYTSVHSVAATYQPFALATTEIEKEIISAQRDMFEYLSELTDSPEKAISHLDILDRTLQRAKERAPGDKIKELEEIGRLAAKYRATIGQIPMLLQGSRDWSRVYELRASAIRFGGEVADRAATLAKWSNAEIEKRNGRSGLLTTVEMGTFVLVLGLSVVVLLALKHWWKRFQDLILGI